MEHGLEKKVWTEIKSIASEYLNRLNENKTDFENPSNAMKLAIQMLEEEKI